MEHAHNGFHNDPFHAEELVFDSLRAKTEALALQNRFAAQYGDELTKVTNEEAVAFLNQAGASETTRAYLFRLIATEQVFGNSSLDTESKIQKLKELATAYGQTAIVARIASMEAAAQDPHIPIDYDDELAALKNEIEHSIDNIQIDFSNTGIPAASSAGASAGKSYIEAFEEELKALEELRDSGLISEKQYLDRLRLLYERYFKDKADYEKEYARYKRQYLDGYKSLYESVFSHASGLIDEQIDGIQDEKDAAVSALEAQKKAAEDSYNAQIKLLEDKKDALQDEIDKIREANEDRKEAIRLQEKERNLARAENQKTILQYTEGRGFFYTADTDAIRDARNELDDAKAEAGIRVLEKQQDALDKQIDSIENMNYIELKNGIYDDLYLTRATDFTLDSKITEGWTFDTILWAKFNGNTNAGNVDWSVDTVSHLLLKRRTGDRFVWNTLVVKEILSIDDFNIYYNDYTTASGAVYEYAIVPVLHGTEGIYSSCMVESAFDDLFIIEDSLVYSTDITDGFCDTTRNVPSAAVELLNSKYPIFIRNSIANYDSGTCKGSFVPFEEDECTRDFSAERDYKRITFQKNTMDILADGIPKILKLPDGRIWLIQTTPNPTDTAEDAYNNRYITFSWVEIGDIDSEEDLYYLGLSEVTEEWWNK